MGKVDTGGKKIINIYNQAWVEWLLHHQQVTVETELSGDFQFVARASDSLLQVAGPHERFLVLTELQFKYDDAMPERLAAYAFLARHKYKQSVYVVVVYFIPPAADKPIVNTFNQELMDQVARQDFRPVLLWELEAEQVLAYDNPALLPFTPLMRGGDTEQMIRRCANRIRREPQAAELETILALFAGYVLDPTLIKQILRWEMQIVQESPLMQELREEWLAEGIEQGIERGIEQGIEQGLEQGIEQGIEQGERKATLEALRQTLTIRFKIDRAKFDEPLARLAVVSLKKLHEVALTAPTLPAFEAALTEMLSAPEKPASPSNDALTE